MKKQELHCTTPKIVSYPVEGVKNPKKWYVYFRIKINDRLEIKRYLTGINSHKTFEERMEAAIKLRDSLSLSLSQGWIPNEIVEKVEKISTVPIFKESDISLTNALSLSIESQKPHLANKSYSGYSCTVSRVKETIKRLKWQELKLKDASRMHFRKIMEYIKSDRNWSNRTYNNNLGFLKAIIQECVNMEMIKENPILRMPNLKQEESAVHNPPTDSELKRIKKKLLSVHPNFWKMYCVIYHTGIREFEALELRVKHVDLIDRIITIEPKNSKSKTKYRYVPINDHLYEIFISMDLHMYDKNWFVFGTPFPYATKLSYDKNFRPNPYHIKRDTATKMWKKLIKDEENIDRTMYSGKKRGANDKIADGMSEDALRHLYGHSSVIMIRTYITEKRNIYKEEVNEYSREL